MKQQHFMSIGEFAKLVTVHKVDEDGHKVEWLKIQHIQVRKNAPLKLFFKYSVVDDVPFSCVNFERKGRPLQSRYSLHLLNDQPRLLSEEKAKDLKKLLKYVPPVHHAFYNDLFTRTISHV
jgi:hypothetical protein